MANTTASFPQQLVIELTAGCNQACIFCGRTYMERPKRTMTDTMFKKIIDEVVAENPYTEVWPTFMGEAFLLGDRLFDLIRYAKEAGLHKVTLNTNGTKLNEKTIPRILDCGLDRFIISCDAHTPETHRRVRPPINPNLPDSLEAIYKGIHLLLDAMKQTEAKKPLVEVQYSIFDENTHEVEAFQQYWLEHGVIIKVRPKVYWSGSVEGGSHRVTLKERQTCMWAIDSAAIQWNGNVVMCPIDCEGKYVAGNIQRQSLSEIWNGPLAWMRELQLTNRFSELPEICRKCPDWKVKKAHAYYPDGATQEAYEQYVTLGRVYTEAHYWHEDSEKIR